MSFARSFAEGLKTGVSIYQTAEEAKDRKKRTAMEEERAAREKERYEREKGREDAAKEQADALVALQQARESGTGIFESLRREPTPTGIAPPPAGQSPLGAPSAPNTTGITPPDVIVRPLVTEPAPVGVELPADGSPTPPPRMGLQGTQSGAAESVAPEMRGAAADAPAQKPAEFNLFKSGGEGLYRNQREADRLYYSELEKIYTKLYSSTGQYEKLPAVKDTVRKMREADFDPMRKMTAAALISGNTKAFEMFNRASAVTDFGYTIDASGASYDNATKTFKGLKFVDAEGNATAQDMSVAEGLAFLNQMDPAKVLEYITGRGDRAQDVAFTERGLDLKQEGNKLESEKIDVERDKNRAWERVMKERVSVDRDMVNSTREATAMTNGAQTAINTIRMTLGLDKEPKRMDFSRSADYDTALNRYNGNLALAGDAGTLWSMNSTSDGRYRPSLSGSEAVELMRDVSKGKIRDYSDNGDGTVTATWRGKKVILPNYDQSAQ